MSTTPGNSSAVKILAEAARRARDNRPILSRRVDDRFPINAVIPLSGDSPIGGRIRGRISAWGVDVSRSGIGLLTEKPLEEGSLFYADFSEITGNDCVLAIKVLNSAPLFGNVYRVSAAFAS